MLKFLQILGIVIAAVIIIILGVVGSMRYNYTKLIKEICDYLEVKYGGRYVVTRLISDRGEGIPSKAFIHPEGNETEWFVVRIYTDDDTGIREFSDGYAFLFVEKEIFPEYQPFIAAAEPNAKIALHIDNSSQVTSGDYDRDVSFDGLIENERAFVINIKIFVSDDLLTEKEAFFEKMSWVMTESPRKNAIHKYMIIFIKEYEFVDFDVQKHKGSGFSTAFKELDEIMAYTYVNHTQNKEQSEIYDILMESFRDVSNFSIGNLLNQIRGEGNE
ncbi:MAG: hypothetical protein FWE14_06880 [Lachnospiraceae bacterium]|nr:hypothetical protein [Lachnospiraceae bacterium]